MSKRIMREEKTISLMIAMFCKAKHHSDQTLCHNCSQLDQYARERTKACQFGDHKPVCSKCPVHCYNKDMRERIKVVMRYSGPRMIISYPGLALMHIIDKYRSQPNIIQMKE